VTTVGLVTGVATGTATISYSVSNSCDTASATQAITVTPSSACETSVAATTGDELTLFPNPSDGTFTLAIPSTLHVTSIALYDLLGRYVPALVSDSSTPGDTKVVVDNVAAGNYIVKVITEDKTYQRTITIR
jgi:hypothetical protein